MHICCPIEEILRTLLLNERKPLVPLSNYIGYGVKSHMYEFPWLAKLQYRSGKCEEYCSILVTSHIVGIISIFTEVSGVLVPKCAGSIIQKSLILTAAHCVSNSRP